MVNMSPRRAESERTSERKTLASFAVGMHAEKYLRNLISITILLYKIEINNKYQKNMNTTYHFSVSLV